jgi:hypothetical protein
MAHDPISEGQRDMMNVLAEVLDDTLNGTERPKRVGFALLTYKFGEDLKGTGRVNYIGNGQRSDVLVALKEVLARWEGRYAETTAKQ